MFVTQLLVFHLFFAILLQFQISMDSEEIKRYPKNSIEILQYPFFI